MRRGVKIYRLFGLFAIPRLLSEDTVSVCVFVGKGTRPYGQPPHRVRRLIPELVCTRGAQELLLCDACILCVFGRELHSCRTLRALINCDVSTQMTCHRTTTCIAVVCLQIKGERPLPSARDYQRWAPTKVAPCRSCFFARR